MELIDALRSTGAIRDFTQQPVDDETLARVLDTARFAPSGANRQAWRIVVVKDGAARRRLRDLYLPGWYDYLAMTQAGLRPWAPGNDPDEEARAVTGAAEIAAAAAAAAAAPAPDAPAPDATAPGANTPGGFAEQLDKVPVLLALFADLSALSAVDRDTPRYSFAGGASIYPFAWSILLAAREEGLGGVLTTMAIREEDAVLALLGASPPLALAGVIALGHPVRRPRRLRRAPVESFVTIDTIDGTPFGGSTTR